jgi:hypothetical protein
MTAYPEKYSEQNNAHASAVTGKATGTIIPPFPQKTRPATISFCKVFVAIFFLRKEFCLNFVYKVLTEISYPINLVLL